MLRFWQIIFPCVYINLEELNFGSSIRSKSQDSRNVTKILTYHLTKRSSHGRWKLNVSLQNMRSLTNWIDLHWQINKYLGCIGFVKKQRLAIFIVSLFDLEIGYGTGQNRQQGTRQKQEFLSLTKSQDNFLSTVQLFKIWKYPFYFWILKYYSLCTKM
jgi:hypothetical protein